MSQEQKYDFIIQNKTLIHKSCFTNEKYNSHDFYKICEYLNVYECLKCNLNIFTGDHINEIKNDKLVMVTGCYIFAGKNYINYGLSCGEMIIKSIIQ